MRSPQSPSKIGLADDHPLVVGAKAHAMKKYVDGNRGIQEFDPGSFKEALREAANLYGAR
jgi:hypothetical protein